MTNSVLPMRVTRITPLTTRIISLTFEPVSKLSLPPVVAGSHIDVHMPIQGGIIRQYSLTNTPGCQTHYQIAVQRENHGRGGSLWLHNQVSVGDILNIGIPRNLFTFSEMAPHHVLIAGGIGIVPIWSLARALMQRSSTWELHYAAPSQAEAVFFDDILMQSGKRLTSYFPSNGQPRLSLSSLAKNCRTDAHIYCCGPNRMMTDFDISFSFFPEIQRHKEHFSAVANPAKHDGFEVVLAKSGRNIHVKSDQTILEALREAGISAAFSCSEGVCGMCETRILEGVADHRDSVLTADEQRRGETMMICCSGVKTPRIVLDI